MAIYGLTVDRKNPEFTKNSFVFWMPQYKLFFFNPDGTERTENNEYWTELYDIADKKIYYSIFGTDWKLAMSLCLAHYLTIIANREQAPSGSTLAEVSGGGVTQGILTSANIGGFSKSFDLAYSMLSSDEAKFWNTTSYGTQLMALYKTKGTPSVFVVTSGPEYPVDFYPLDKKKPSGY